MSSIWSFIDPWFYSQVYVGIIALLTFICFFQYSKKDCLDLEEKSVSKSPSFILAIIVTLFLGLRPLSGAFLDMLTYIEMYNSITDGRINIFDGIRNNFIFNFLLKSLALNRADILIFFFLIACIYIGGIYFSLNRIFSKRNLFYAFVIYLGAFSTFSYGTNGIKAGAAASIFLLVFAYYKKPLLVALFCFLSLGFHHSMIVVIYAFLLSYFIKNPKWYFGGWVFCLLMALFHVTFFQSLFTEFTNDESAAGYLQAGENDWGGRSGFRWDFILYSLPPIALAWWCTHKYRIKDRLYQLLFCTYLTTNAVWMLCMYMPYNNRLAYLSWFLLPILICYPFFKFQLYSTQYKTLNLIVGVYLAFTAFTTFGGFI